MENTIKWYKVKISLFTEPIGIQYWKDVVDFVTHFACFDYEIKGMKTELFDGVTAKYTKEDKIEMI